jgi:outer membrane lipoprotein-sorting protein
VIRYFNIIFFFFLITNSVAVNKEKIIENLKKTQNLNFQFEQNINGKIENGNCTIKYPRMIFCKYLNNKNKLLVSNGKSLVVKTKASYYRYPLKKTPLDLLLNKKFLINKINTLNNKIIYKKYINYKIIEKNNEIDIFFDNQTYDLIGWQTKDIYQNLSITFFSSIKKNQKIAQDLFKLPAQN